MPKVLTSTEVQSRFGSVLKWTADHKDEVIVELYGKPAAVLIPYEEYEKVVQLREEARRRKAWKTVEVARNRVRARNADLSQEDAYRLAGFSEEVVQETIAADEVMHHSRQAGCSFAPCL